MWRRINKPTSALTALLLIGMAGCVDLDVVNPNEPDTERALATPGDVESLIAGAYDRWLRVQWYNSFPLMMSNAAGQHVAPWANAGMEQYARIPRVPTNNQAGAADVGNVTYAWFQAYRAIAAVRDGLRTLEDSGEAFLGAQRTVRAKAYGRYMLGLAHATVAAAYDSGFIYDETVDPTAVTLRGYQDVMAAALGYFGDAITLANSDPTFTIPEEWMSVDVPATTLIRLAYSQRARFRAAVARTPAERAAVDWDAVAADAANGVTADWEHFSTCFPHQFCEEAVGYMQYPGWQMQNNWVAGMADTSGHYQAWITTPLSSKLAFMIFTPDTRWPQGGSTALSDSVNEATQRANPGAYYVMNSGGTRIWSRPDRGTWRWSYYEQRYPKFYTHGLVDQGLLPQVTVREMKALIAERDFRAGDFAAVATFVNETRATHGLNATDAAGTNTSCVPKLPNGTCGDLWEMFKWEKRLETQFTGPLRSGWWLDGRGWGDLMRGTILHFPVPYQDMQILLKQPYNYGGVGGSFGAPVGTYGY